MANKFYGSVGYCINQEIRPGVWRDEVIERKHYGDILQNYQKNVSTENLNDDIEVNNKISILIDPFAMQHFQSIKYVKWMGTAWKVSMAEVQYPRLILTIGSVYNGETAATA